LSKTKVNKKNQSEYRQCERDGLDVKLPEINSFANQFRAYTITIVIPEYTSVCPRTGQPDFGTITIEYEPAKLVIELKSLKLYVQGYRNLGIFYENAVNRILDDIVDACKPKWCKIKGEFTPRGGIKSTVEVTYPRKTRKP
jgi:7-cyano-7-deazaguanine reductase